MNGTTCQKVKIVGNIVQFLANFAIVFGVVIGLIQLIQTKEIILHNAKLMKQDKLKNKISISLEAIAPTKEIASLLHLEVSVQALAFHQVFYRFYP